ncbi:MAG: family 20 glycosylhydrolase [Planctomycetaceae bacterium]
MKTAFQCLCLLLCVASPGFPQEMSLVPEPVSVVRSDGTMDLPATIHISGPADPTWQQHLRIVATHIERGTNGKHKLSFEEADKPVMVVRQATNMPGDAYDLVVTKTKIECVASTVKGLSHATATLMQLIGSAKDGQLPLVRIADLPQSGYRSFMVDMGRNPHSVQLLKETIDLLWFYKVDSLHLHLTDDQRFAFPSTAFPKLWDKKISLEEFRELERYAVNRGVTLIPELEVPGHSSLLRRHYPESFGKTATDLAKSDAAFKATTTLLDEMMDVFASTPMIHIGGDEAFGVPEELQRSFINRLNRYLKSKSRQTVVWEGPRPGTGDNKVDTDVVHINWRTINYPADQMLKDGYEVVNAAWDPLYLVDHYPRINFTMTSPQHIYKTLAVRRFKHVNPQIRTYAKPIVVDPNPKLIGFCMPWWEGREENFFPQVVPRIIPFAEVAWNSPAERDLAAFEKRSAQTERVRLRSFYPVRITASQLAVPSDGVFHNETAIQMKLAGDTIKNGQIRFTLDGSEPTTKSTLFEDSISISQSTTVRAAMFSGDQQIGHGSRQNFVRVVPVPNLALGKPVTSSTPSAAPFSVERLTDGGTGKLDFYLGYPAEPEPIQVTVDLQQVTQVARVVVHAYSISNSFEKYTVEVSQDGETFQSVGDRLEKPKESQPKVEHSFTARPVRFVRISSSGNKGYVFDSFSKLVEIQVFGPE